LVSIQPSLRRFVTLSRSVAKGLLAVQGMLPFGRLRAGVAHRPGVLPGKNALYTWHGHKSRVFAV